ncbi:unnamed protein product [Alternaria alternata]
MSKEMSGGIKNGVFQRNNTKPPADSPAMQFFSLAGKTAIISGAGQGIGLMVAKTFAEAGANVAIWYNSNNMAIEEADNIEKVFKVKWDESFIDSNIARYLEVMDINTNGFVYCAHVAGSHFRRQKQEGTTLHGTELDNSETGSFIATASMSGHIVNIPRRQAAYNASKAAVIHMCKSLAIEWLNFARVNTVSPGFIETTIAGPIADDVMSAIMDKVPMG